jgi:hypothetical protein
LREPFLSEKSATFLKLILLKFLENANNARSPRPAFGGGGYASTKFSHSLFEFWGTREI